MTTVYLTHVDPTRNMARFYTMSLQATLFAECSLVREWGRIGQGGQMKTNVFSTEDAARTELERIRRTKLRRGYGQH
jgi:predicted DNA-binding WGR domain protein